MVRRTTSDLSAVSWHIAELDQLRGRNTFRLKERLLVLRVYYGLHREAHESIHVSIGSRAVKARERTARICGKVLTVIMVSNYSIHFIPSKCFI